MYHLGNLTLIGCSTTRLQKKSLGLSVGKIKIILFDIQG